LQAVVEICPRALSSNHLREALQGVDAIETLNRSRLLFMLRREIPIQTLLQAARKGSNANDVAVHEI
jgi:hypothetical protein